MTSAVTVQPAERGSVRFGDTLIEYTVVRSARRKKTLEITLDHQEGVLVAAPVETPAGRIADLVRKRAAWIITRANSQVLAPVRKQLVSGESLPYLGRQVRLFVESAHTKRPVVTFSHWSFRVSCPHHLQSEQRRAAIARALERWYKRRAQDRLTARTWHWAQAIGCQPGRVLVRDQRQRWGSCSPDGTLRFNWRVVQLEPSLIDYIVVHELVHLHIRNHSAHFWAAIARILPDYRIRRQRLKEAGPQLVF